MNKTDKDLVLYCCSFHRDVDRVVKLVESIQKYNSENIPVYISCPKEDMNLFLSKVDLKVASVLCEEEIIRKIPHATLTDVYSLKGGKLQQQIIKSEFWRMGLAENTLVLDSDCQFLRPFSRSDFMVDSSTPYSVIHEGKSFLRFTSRFGPERARAEWQKDRLPIQLELKRPGQTYDFGYAPFIWSAKVWESLYENHLLPRGENIIDAIKRHPSELTWYGEALLKYRAIVVWPREELFRHYHYEHEFWLDRRLGINQAQLAKDFLGVVRQSNWEHRLDHGRPSKSIASRLARRIRRWAKWIRFHWDIL